jgi:hypothetical protein
MSLALKIIILVVVILVVGVAALRIRKLRRDEIRELSRPVERRLMSPPPSPYAPSKGFRLLDGPLDPTRRPEPLRPRLETDREYVFSETQMPGDGEVVPSHLRHNEKWALSKSARRSASFTGLRVGIVALVVVVIVCVIALFLQQHPKTGGIPRITIATTTTTPRSTTTTTASALPSSFVATSTSGETATYRVRLKRYLVVVHGALGPTWAVYKMGPQSTLEWQGDVKAGQVESLQMTGDSQITIGAPKSASVTVEGKSVAFPSPLPSTLVLSFVSS